MGLHNLESDGFFDIVNEFSEQVDLSQAHGWLDNLLSQYGSLPNAPWSTQAELLAHMLSAVRGLRFSFARRNAMRKLEALNRVIELHADRRLGIYIEYVDMESVEATLARYTVWKGTLFEVQTDRNVVCWHPDKEFMPKATGRVYRTKYSELGKRQRMRDTRPG